ncbi:MAG: AF1514 family protein [Desulfobulbaceae bacterium]|nr:AF1514 family protein [Desulfobulbaceae bacterium]
MFPGTTGTGISSRRPILRSVLTAAAKDGYIHYGLSHGAKLKIDIEDGRFVFFFAPVEW